MNLTSLPDDTPSILFDFPTVAPGATVTEQFVSNGGPLNDVGLLEILLAGSPGTVDTEILTMIGNCYTNSSLTDSLGAAPDSSATVTATTIAPPAVPEPGLLP